ncbi:protein kinase [Rubrobacter tropicus]|uniref:non-specific serine/threonine protein kinase n=1 Tax=Rubrobacter tropicus TaxID=2653851 RepID=A0A6G8QBI1_9ACTN|nr:protein kinase [Rubrobacter tropicus]
MARVFLGRDEVLDRPVAVKVLKPMHGETDIAARFRREGRTAARLSHPNIVQVYDAGEGDLDGDEVSYIVMEYLSGGDLKERIDERGPLPAAELAGFGEEVCAGLAHAHGRGVVHRDIKPHNILLDEKGRAKVSDFGIARALDTTQATRTGAYLGTALYSSPEQLQGYKVTPKSDVYSLGATLYQAATGEPPFTGTPIEVASQHVSKPPPPMDGRGAGVGEELQALILACLAKNADDRPSTEEALKRFASAARPWLPSPYDPGRARGTGTRTAARGPDGRLLGGTNPTPGPDGRRPRRAGGRGRARRDRGPRPAKPSPRRTEHRTERRPAEPTGERRGGERGQRRQREPGVSGKRRRRREHAAADYPEHRRLEPDARAFGKRLRAGRAAIWWRISRGGRGSDGGRFLPDGRRRRLPEVLAASDRRLSAEYVAFAGHLRRDFRYVGENRVYGRPHDDGGQR